MKRVKEGAKWTWSALRPGAVIGFSLGSALTNMAWQYCVTPLIAQLLSQELHESKYQSGRLPAVIRVGYMNLLDFFAVYGTLCKETGTPFRYPGDPVTYRVVMDCVDVDLLTMCQIWLSTHPKAQNTAYNINNGDVFRFEQVWPAMAQWFGVETGPPLKIPLPVFMPQHKDTWSHIRKKYHLKDLPYDHLHQADFAEAWLSYPADAFNDVTKLRRAGFDRMNIWSEECLISWLNELAKDKVIPDYPAMRKGHS
ncbi:g2379 [Coccomyxa viridis]|uniref:G2379 protein n=1 Tax=Coccomyxa viridis TaxID=1274662 RepID=A0ABP1FK98_9CHLO